MSFKILHFASDDKFIPLTIELYEEAFPGCNNFRILQRDQSFNRFVEESPLVRRVDAAYFYSSSAVKDLQSVDCLILHSALRPFVYVVPNLRPSVLLVWCGWGFDYYSDLLERQFGPLVFPATQQLLDEISSSPKHFITEKVSKSIAVMTERFGHLKKLTAPHHPLVTIASRINVYSVLPQEVDMLAKALPQLKGKLHCLRYYTMEDSFAVSSRSMEGPDILLGNSASPTNNHLEALKMLADLKISGRKIFLPLTYGSSEYGDAVTHKAQKLFADQVVSQRNHMPLGEFAEQISTCGIVLMNHRRQQGIGTLTMGLFRGAKVFVPEDNPLLPFYREMGVKIFSTRELMEKDDALEPLGLAEREMNRGLIEAFWSRKVAIAQIRVLANLR